MKLDLNAKLSIQIQKNTKAEKFLIKCLNNFSFNLSPLLFMTTLLSRYHQMELTFYFTMLKLFKRVVRETFAATCKKFSISNDRHPESGK